MGDSPPALLDGYQLGEVLGKGTQGTVYKARVRGKGGSNKVVAVKCVMKNKLSGAARDNIVTEIGLLKKLSHRFIVELVDFHWDDRYIYIVMEYCGGGDLGTVIKQRRCLPESQVQRFLQQLASALQYLRQHQVSHMDLKPCNLLVSDTNPPVLKLADFGLAQHLAGDKVDKGLKGSPLYMAPEILTKDRFTAKADLWSIGVILYEALFGRAPFSSESLEELVSKIKEDSPVIIPTSRKLSRDCRDLLSRCLVRCPEKRIDFKDFFQHPFLDLEHLPDENSLQKASELVTRAVEADRDKRTEQALELYEKSLKYFIPLVHYEEDQARRARLKSTVEGYVKRVQQLRQTGSGVVVVGPSNPKAEELLALCRTNSPELATGVEICLTGEDYMREGELEQALDRLTAGLGVLVPALAREPRGLRRDLLGEMVKGWMERGERVKECLRVQEAVLGGNTELVSEARQASSCSLQ